MRGAIFAVVAVLSSIDALAGGSIRLDTELEPVLSQKPVLKNFIMETFDLAEGGWTPNRIGWQVNEKFGGRRLGPYSLRAKPKGYVGGYIFELIVHTEHIFLDGEGNPTHVGDADEIREKFNSIEVRLLQECRIDTTLHERDTITESE